MSALRAALLGFGHVGRALAERLLATAAPVRVVAVTDRSGTVVDAEGLDLARLLEAKRGHGAVAAYGGAERWSAREAAGRAPADVVAQLTPTDLRDPEAALAELEAAFASGKDVVTAAKGALALAPRRVRDAAREHGARLLHSGAVGGSVPVLETLGAAFAGDRLLHLEAVLNGSTTYILSRLEEGASLTQALDEASRRGILEADPTLDLLGHDAAAKAAILHQVAYRSDLALPEVETRGIAGITPSECLEARRSGFAVRLVARVDARGARVAPVHVPRESPLATTGATCAVRFVFEGAGTVALSGPGAGPGETASAVLSDLLALAGARPPVHAPASALPAAVVWEGAG